MTLKMLPNWCKKLGLGIFIVGSSISAYKGFMEGYTATYPKSEKYNFLENLYSDSTLHLFDVLAIIGMLIYMFSKEKIEDDYINKLRLESYQLTSLIGLLICIILYIFSQTMRLSLDYFINIFLMFYLVIFAIKKRAD